MITCTGLPPGVTYYYNLLPIVWDAFFFTRGRRPIDIQELASFVLDNLRWSRERQAVHRSRYFTLGALLGSRELGHHVMPSGPRAESELWPEQYACVPALCAMADMCDCGICRGPGERVFCHACRATLGCTWPEFRRRYEASVVGEQWDVLIGNNLMQLHAADSSAERTIRPICIVLDTPDTDEYESWLAGQWRTYLGTSDFSRPEVRAA